MRLKNLKQTRVTIGNSAVCVYIAETYFQKLRGLLGIKSQDFFPNAIAIKDCKSIHTFGMKNKLDVIFISHDDVVVKVYRNLKPNRILSQKNSVYVLESISGSFELPEIGSFLKIKY